MLMNVDHGPDVDDVDDGAEVDDVDHNTDVDNVDVDHGGERMSHQGRGNAIIAAVVLVVCMVVLLRCEVAQGSNFTVGDAGGWTFSVSGWPNGKSFKAGDILVFNYSPGIHNVVAVGKADHDNCNVPNGAKTYTSGRDQIRLAKGPNYFICGIPGHCGAGMRIAVTAN
ncbi:hypothetical protein ACSBR1_019174 [Camellia fascicularis]